jgi:hypothetical protein
VKINYVYPAFLLLLSATVAGAATYTELAQQSAPISQYNYPVNYGYPANYAPMQVFNGMPNRYPPYPGMGMQQTGANGQPNAQQIRWSYGQVNAASDAFNAWGLRTQGMYIPWSTPMSAWSNAQQWDWWRNRAGDTAPIAPMW